MILGPAPPPPQVLMSWSDMDHTDAWVNALHPQGSNVMSGAWGIALALHVCQRVDVYGFTTTESQAASLGARYHYYDLQESPRLIDNLHESGWLISELAHREPRLRLHRPPSSLLPELQACNGASSVGGCPVLDPFIDPIATYGHERRGKNEYDIAPDLLTRHCSATPPTKPAYCDCAWADGGYSSLCSLAVSQPGELAKSACWWACCGAAVKGSYTCEAVTRTVKPRRLDRNDPACQQHAGRLKRWSKTTCAIRDDGLGDACPLALPVGPLSRVARAGCSGSAWGERMKYHTCAVVSNGGAMLKSGCGGRIDAAENVFRVEAPVLGPAYSSDLGSRTDAQVFGEELARHAFT